MELTCQKTCRVALIKHSVFLGALKVSNLLSTLLMLQVTAKIFVIGVILFLMARLMALRFKIR